MADTSDFKSIYDDMAPAQAPAPGNMNLPQQPQDSPMAQLGQFGANLGVQSQMNEDPVKGFNKATFKKDGTVQLDIHRDVFESYLRDKQQLNEIRGSFHQEAERLRRRQEQMQTTGGAIGSAFSRLAGNLAMQKDMPGWVRGLGMTAAQLNPTQEELSQERLKVLGGEANIAEKQAGLDQRMGEAGIQREQMDLAKTREERLARSSFQSEHVNAAIRGEGDPASTTKLGVEMGVVKPEQAEAFQQNLEALKKSYFEKQEAAEKLKMGREIQVALAKAGVDEQKQARTFAQQDYLLGKRMEAMSAENDRKAERADKRAEAKKTELKDFETKELEQYVAADKALDEVEALLKTPEAKKYMGYATGTVARIGAKFAPKLADPNGVIAGIDSKLKLQTAQAIKSTGAGARGFGPQERPFFESLAEGITRSPEQNQRIIDTWREYLDQGRKGVLANHTDETLKKYPKMFGARLAPTAGAATISKDDFDEWLKSQGKK